MQRSASNPAQPDDGSWRIRDFLRSGDACLSSLLRRGYAVGGWHVARPDYWRWHVVENCRACHAGADGHRSLWETPDGRIAAVLNPEGRSGGAFSDASRPAHAGARRMPCWTSPSSSWPMAAGWPVAISLVFADHGDAVRRSQSARRGQPRAGDCRMPRNTSAARCCRSRSGRLAPVATRCGRWATWPSCRPELGFVAGVPPR